MKRHHTILSFLIITLISFSCSEYNKVLKGDDIELKYTKALEYYDSKDYYKSMTLFEEVYPHYRITKKGEKSYYLMSMSHYNVQEYYTAGVYFRNFSKSFPNSEHAEECAFLAAYTAVLNSPYYSLDQTNTYKALNELQLFLNRYPESTRIDTCNVLIDELRGKLERKKYEGAKQYYQIENYKSSVVALESVLETFPETKYKEDVFFLILKSNFYLANRSIDAKKEERYRNTIKSYHTFVDRFSNSDKMKEAEAMYKDCVKFLEH